MIEDNTYSILDPFRLNEWPLRKMNIAIITVLAIFCGLFLLDYSNINTSIFGTAFDLAIILFVPGFLLMRLFKIVGMGRWKTFCVSLSLSIFFLFTLALLANFLLPLIEITAPLTPNVIGALFTISIVILISLINYFKNEIYDIPLLSIHNKDIPIFCMLSIFPVFAIFSTRIMNQYSENDFQLILLAGLTTVVLLSVITNRIPERLFPLVVFYFTFTLFMMNSLRSSYLIEWADGLLEYWVSNFTLINGYWHPELALSLNPLLSLSIFPPMITLLTDLNLVWVYRIVFPFILSIVVAMSYCIFTEHTTPKIALTSIVIITGSFSFYGMMLGLNRQTLALLFFISFIWIMNDVNGRIKTALLIIMGVGVGLSHYGTSTMFLMTLIAATAFILMLRILARCLNKQFFNNSHNKYSVLYNYKYGIPTIMIISIITIAWYIVVSDGLIIQKYLVMFGSSFEWIIRLVVNSSSFYGNTVLATDLGTTLRTIRFNEQDVVVYLIAVGFLLSIVFKLIPRKNIDYWAISTVLVVILIFTQLVPSTRELVDSGRFINVCLYIVAPFAVLSFLGIEKIIKLAIKWKKKGAFGVKIAIFLFIVMLLIDTGVVEELSGNPSHRTMLWEERIAPPNFTEYEVRAAKWCTAEIGTYKNVTSDSYTIYTDTQYAYLINSQTGSYNPLQGNNSGVTTSISNNSYFFIGSNNLENNLFGLEKPGEPARVSIAWVFLTNIDLYTKLNNMDRIYSAPGVQIFIYNGET